MTPVTQMLDLKGVYEVIVKPDKPINVFTPFRTFDLSIFYQVPKSWREVLKQAQRDNFKYFVTKQGEEVWVIKNMSPVECNCLQAQGLYEKLENWVSRGWVYLS